MTLAQLKILVAAYLGKTPTDLTVGGVDLFLVAANNARREAEQLHNFEMSRISGTLNIDGTAGGQLSAIAINGGSSNSVVVTGTITPADALGTYYANGTVGGKTYYERAGTALWKLYWSVTDTSWYIQRFTDYNDTSLLWGRSAPNALVTGTFNSPLGGATGTATATLGATTFSGVKEITAVTRVNSIGYSIPVPYMREDMALDRDRDLNNLDADTFYYFRYPSDADFLLQHNATAIVQRNNALYIYPGGVNITSPYAVGIRGYGWLSEYTDSNLTDTNPTDYFIQYGPSYMQWACICELNYLFQRFVSRQEGVLSAPEKKKEEAWQKLLVWDAYSIDSNVSML